MSIKKTALLAEELKVIAETFPSNYCRNELLAAAERLTDLERIAEFYRTELTKKIGGRSHARVCFKRSRVSLLQDGAGY